eukprot:6485011-Lingulodinium_polyedra.AAC.1
MRGPASARPGFRARTACRARATTVECGVGPCRSPAVPGAVADCAVVAQCGGVQPARPFCGARCARTG